MLSSIFFKYIFIIISFFKYKCINSEGFTEIILNKYEYEINVSKYDLTILNLNTELYDMKYSLINLNLSFYLIKTNDYIIFI